MSTYAEAQQCRRQALLAYFGEDTQPCGNCDNCLNPVETKDGRWEAETVFGAIFETGERYGQAHVIEVLTGAETEKVLQTKHDRLECHGMGERYSKTAWRSIIRQMLAAGYLEVDVAGYSSLLITEKGNRLSRGEGEFRYRDDPLKPSRSKTGDAGPYRKVSDAELSVQDRGLLAQLKRTRLALAKERNVPAYVIFPDKTLIEMARLRPVSLHGMESVKGVGKRKLAEFGEVFLAEIASS